MLFLMGAGNEKIDYQQIVKIVSSRFPNAPRKILKLNKKANFVPNQWAKELESAAVVFYLTKSPFDWPTLALETMYWNIPTIFMEQHHSLSELLPNSPLGLSKFLIEQPDLAKIQQSTKETRLVLDEHGAFAPLALAHQYREIYNELEVRFE